MCPVWVYGILWHFGIFAKKPNKKSNPIFPILSDFFRLLDFSRLLDFPIPQLYSQLTELVKDEKAETLIMEGETRPGKRTASFDVFWLRVKLVVISIAEMILVTLTTILGRFSVSQSFHKPVSLSVFSVPAGCPLLVLKTPPASWNRVPEQ